MKKIFYIFYFHIYEIGCASPTAFMGNGIFSLGASQSFSKAAISSGADYYKKRDRKKQN